MSKELNEFFSMMANEKAKDPKNKIIKQVKENIKEDLSSLFTQLSAINTTTFVPKDVEKQIDKLVEDVKEVEKQDLKEQGLLTPVGLTPPELQIPNIDKYVSSSVEVSAPVDPLSKQFKTIDGKIKFLEQWIAKIQNAGPGGGEVNLRYLDDVDRASIGDRRYMRYNATSKKFEFGEISLTLSDITTALGFTPVSNTVQVLTSNFITVSTTTAYNLSSESSYNILDVTAGGLTATLNLPINPINGQMVTFAVIRNTITLAKGAGTVNPPFDGGFALGTSFTYTYREVDDTWYRVG